MRDLFQYSYLISLALLFVFLCLFYPIVNFLWKAFNKDSIPVLVYFICLIIVFSFFGLSSLYLDPQKKAEHYTHSVGNCGFFSSWILKKDGVESKLSPYLNKSNNLLIKTWRNVEDHCRYEKLNYLFNLENQEAPALCKRFLTKDKFTCFSDLRSLIVKKTPYSEYGFIKAQIISAKILSQDPHNAEASREFGPKDSSFLGKLLGYDRILQVLESRFYLKVDEITNPNTQHRDQDITFDYQKDVWEPLVKEKTEEFEKSKPIQWLKEVQENISKYLHENFQFGEKEKLSVENIDQQLADIDRMLEDSTAKLSQRQRDLLEYLRFKYIELRNKLAPPTE